MADYIQDFKFKVKNTLLFFQLRNLLRLQIRSLSENSTDVIFENVMTNRKLPESLKRRFGSVDGLFTHFQFDAKQFECKFIQTQKDAKLSFSDEKNFNYEISFLPLIKCQEEPGQKEKNELEKLLERQNELKENIARLQEDQQKKTKHLSSLTEQITKAEQKIAQTPKLLEEANKKQLEIDKLNQILAQKTNQLSSLTEQKAKAEQELLAFKTKLLEETRKKQVKISFQKHPKYGEFINYEDKEKMTLQMLGKSVTDQMVQEITQCDLSRIQILSLGQNKITNYGFDLLFTNREWSALQEIYLWGNKIQKIHSLHKIPNLWLLSIYKNELSEASGTYICEHQWPVLRELWISFKRGLNDNFYDQRLTRMSRFSQSMFSISRKNQEKIHKFCEDQSIELNVYQ